MSTSSIALGQVSQLAFADQSAFATPAPSGYRYAYYYKSDLKETKPIEADPVIGAGYNNFRDATPPAPSLSEHGGTLELPLCLNAMGDWLRLLFGAPTTTGATNFTHVFNSGNLVAPTRTIELSPIASDFRQHIGCAAKSIKMDVKDDKGYQRAVLEIGGRGEELLGASSAGAVAAARTYDPIKATGGVVLLAGVQVGVLLSASMTYEAGLVLERYIDGSARAAAAVLADQAQFTGELRVRYTGPTFDAAAVAETDQSLEFQFTRGANNSLSFFAPAARLERAGVAIDGPGGFEQALKFRAAQTTGAPMLTATLKNQVATY